MSHTREEKIEAFGRFIDILDILREKCPWDHKQKRMKVYVPTR